MRIRVKVLRTYRRCGGLCHVMTSLILVSWKMGDRDSVLLIKLASQSS